MLFAFAVGDTPRPVSAPTCSPSGLFLESEPFVPAVRLNDTGGRGFLGREDGLGAGESNASESDPKGPDASSAGAVGAVGASATLGERRNVPSLRGETTASRPNVMSNANALCAQFVQSTCTRLHAERRRTTDVRHRKNA